MCQSSTSQLQCLPALVFGFALKFTGGHHLDSFHTSSSFTFNPAAKKSQVKGSEAARGAL